MNATRMIGAVVRAASSSAMVLSSLTSAVDAAPTDATPLAAKYSCQACHSIDKKLVGPAYQEVAVKYAGDAAAPAKLAQKIKNGGAGVWGTVPMPPNAVPDADLKTLVDWILALK
jgi:cytochrome c551/c552